MNEPYAMTAVEFECAIQKKRIGIEELIHVYLKRIAQYDGVEGLNTIAELDESAINQARKMDSQKSNRNLPMFGLPILVKDNIDVAGLHTTAGSLALVDNIAANDAPIIANLRKNGAIILGKTNMTEFANYTAQDMPNGYSSRGGQVKNAYDRNKDPGGSSSGSAVAISAGFCAAAVGTDTSFSVIGCDTDNGVVGLKPQLSRYEVLFKTLRSDGVLFTDVSHAIASQMHDIMRCEFRHDLEQYLANSSTKIKTLDEIISMCEFDPERMMKYGNNTLKKALNEASGMLDDAPYLEALTERKRLRLQILENIRGFDACVMIGSTQIMHFIGLPSIALKLCMGNDGIPRGIILYGADESRLFSAALTIKKYCLPIPMPIL